MDTKIKVDKQKNTVTVEMSVLMKPGDPRIKNINVITLLEEKGHKVGKCLKGQVLKNREPKEEVLRTGSWVFELLEDSKAAEPAKISATKTIKPKPSTKKLEKKPAEE
tara:strand:+ start:92 stop:415 length:324 start_codon:yes stop_codon:yes gene_type:complete